MAAAAQTTSLHWRQQGNSLYTSVTEGLSQAVGIERFKQAIQCYQRAFDAGRTEDDKTSAAKNLGMSCWRLVKLMGDGEISYLDTYMVLYHCKEAFKYFSYAYLHGKSVKSEAWTTGVLSSTRACWEDVSSNVLEDLDLDARCRAIYDLTQAIEVDMVKAQSYLKLAECQFHRGIMALQKCDFKKCLSSMRECYMPLNEAPRLTTEDYMLTEVRVMEADVLMHQCMAESIQARTIGDSLFDKVLLEEESLNIDMVWEVIDWYKQATLRTREITEVELEAIAVSRIGRVYERVLKLKYKAKEYYKLAIQLAHSMHPRTFTTEDWYKEATQVVEKYQQDTVSAEEEKRRLEKMEILKMLEKEIKQLKDKSDLENDDFLKFVYKTFPPKKKSHKLKVPKMTDPDSHTKMKKTLQKAIIHYHPDSADEEKHGKKWKVLCEEITKYFTQRYERMK